MVNTSLMDTLKEISDLWPVLLFVGSAVGGYLLLRVRVKQLEEKRDTFDKDLKNLSFKINGFKTDIEKKIDDFKSEVHKNHVSTSTALGRIEGSLSRDNL